MDLFKKQFLLSRDLHTKIIPHFKNVSFHNLNVYHHLDCEITYTENMIHDVLLIGFIIDYNELKHKNSEIIKKISLIYKDKKRFFDYLNALSGRFILVIKDVANYTLIGDACGLRMLFYSTNKNNFSSGSSASIVNYMEREGVYEELRTYNNSQYVKDDIEHFIPSGLSTRNGILSLKPNHMLKTDDLIQERFWPIKNLEISEDYNRSKKLCTEIIKESIHIANSRYDLSFPVTAGWDARLLLSLSKNHLNDMHIYTLKYRDLDEKSSDIYIPRRLLQENNFTHSIIDCTKIPPGDFKYTYESNTEPAHFNDWGIIAYGIYDSDIKDKMCLKGNCSEIVRCYYFSSGDKVKINNHWDLLLFTEPKWKELDFIVKEIERWFNEVNPICKKFGYDILDLFYWEHRMGSWQAQSQLEWDISQEVFTPYNNRKLLDEMLGINSKYRSAPSYTLYKDIINENWKDSLDYKINPKTKMQVLKSTLKRTLSKSGLLVPLKKLYYNIRQRHI
tara:strand:+ start:169 stop:1680 length:1512 start_codon:yes stop_codon:yes gene_type:complete